MSEPSEAAKRATEAVWQYARNHEWEHDRVAPIIQAAIDQACAERDANIAQMVQDMMKDGEHIAGLAERIDQLTRDKERLDWMEKVRAVAGVNSNINGFTVHIGSRIVHGMDLRGVIDAARRGEE